MSKKECNIERSLNPVAEVPFEIEDSINVLDRCWTTVYEEVEELDREGELDEGVMERINEIDDIVEDLKRIGAITRVDRVRLKKLDRLLGDEFGAAWKDVTDQFEDITSCRFSAPQLLEIRAWITAELDAMAERKPAALEQPGEILTPPEALDMSVYDGAYEKLGLVSNIPIPTWVPQKLKVIDNCWYKNIDRRVVGDDVLEIKSYHTVLDTLMEIDIVVDKEDLTVLVLNFVALHTAVDLLRDQWRELMEQFEVAFKWRDCKVATAAVNSLKEWTDKQAKLLPVRLMQDARESLRKTAEKQAQLEREGKLDDVMLYVTPDDVLVEEQESRFLQRFRGDIAELLTDEKPSSVHKITVVNNPPAVKVEPNAKLPPHPVSAPVAAHVMQTILNAQQVDNERARDGKRYFRIVGTDGKQLFTGKEPKVAATHAYSSMCRKGGPVCRQQFFMEEMTAGSKHRVYGPYFGSRNTREKGRTVTFADGKTVTFKKKNIVYTAPMARKRMLDKIQN